MMALLIAPTFTAADIINISKEAQPNVNRGIAWKIV
jgi:hypothetical protein